MKKNLKYKNKVYLLTYLFDYSFLNVPFKYINVFEIFLCSTLSLLYMIKTNSRSKQN